MTRLLDAGEEFLLCSFRQTVDIADSLHSHVVVHERRRLFDDRVNE